jgi:hypothetical protein
VRSIKRPLKKVIGRTSLSFDELRTLIVEIEGLLNARPITYVYDDTEAISYPLAPSHLVYGRRITTSPNTQHYEVVSTPTSFPGLQCEDEGRDEEALVWAGQFCILIV